MVFQRIINIRRGDVGGQPLSLLLCFQVPKPELLYHSQFQVAWRVANFIGEGHEDLSATYISQLFVSNPQTLGGNQIKPNHWIEIDPGQKTVLQPKGSGVGFSPPEKGSGQLIVADNNTGEPKDFGIGFVEGKNAVSLLQFPQIGHGSSLSAEFTPILQAFVVSGYQESVLLRGDIETKKPFWQQDLRPLQPSTNWLFEKDPATGAYSIKSD